MMSESKVFTGPSGYRFTVAGDNVCVSGLHNEYPASVILPVSELEAFVAWQASPVLAEAPIGVFPAVSATCGKEADWRWGDGLIPICALPAGHDGLCGWQSKGHQ